MVIKLGLGTAGALTDLPFPVLDNVCPPVFEPELGHIYRSSGTTLLTIYRIPPSASSRKPYHLHGMRVKVHDIINPPACAYISSLPSLPILHILRHQVIRDYHTGRWYVPLQELVDRKEEGLEVAGLGLSRLSAYKLIQSTSTSSDHSLELCMIHMDDILPGGEMRAS